MSTITPIEARSIHQIQSGQVIVDLCSVIKELVENSLDAGATSIDVRFKSQGLESIEVQDNGAGILPEDYDTIALKHYTSKLSSYDDLGSLDTFGFRGEALSSLCALSHFHILTARDTEAPKGKRLDFETSGKLKSTTVAACPKGTTVAVETLFYNLPVRRRELKKHIKREYGKVLGILHAYACISTGVRLSVSNLMSKGKRVVVFSTNSNPNTKQNISNVFGAKTLLALIPMDLNLELQPTINVAAKDTTDSNGPSSRQVYLEGHVSRPIFGEGRQTPDRQMFFVNSRPCGLPQVAKAFNEVYKSYNITQSPFIFANLRMDTNAYDVNVSPDKRTILLHDQNALLESLKESLNQLFEAQDQTVPQSQFPANSSSSFRPLTPHHAISKSSIVKNSYLTSSEVQQPGSGVHSSSSSSIISKDGEPQDLVQKFAMRNHKDREQEQFKIPFPRGNVTNQSKDEEPRKLQDERGLELELDDHSSQGTSAADSNVFEQPWLVKDFKNRLLSQETTASHQTRLNVSQNKDGEMEIPTITAGSLNPPGSIVQSAFDRMRPKRTTPEMASITVGSNTDAVANGTPNGKRRKIESSHYANQTPTAYLQFSRFAKRVHVYAAPGTRSDMMTQDTNENSDSDNDDLNGGDDPSLMQSISDFRSARHLYNEESDPHAPAQAESEDDSDREFIDETERKRRDEAKVEEMVRRAEAAAARPTREQKKRAANLLKSNSNQDATLSLIGALDTSVHKIENQLNELAKAMDDLAKQKDQSAEAEQPDSSKVSAEERLALTIAKSDFAEMRIIGQFNLGFILATRSAINSKSSEDLFIIDQHASDEIYNFSRLSLTTTLNPQPLVRHHPLELTAIEEETILTHTDTLVKNGFTIAVDESGDSPVGRRCHLLTLPTSRETVFDTRDLEELIALLGDTTPSARGQVIRPSKVRKMLAMRACRSSIMVGKPLTKKGMADVVRHMGEIDRPWNCPHGRPTMRHLAGLGDWAGWQEGDGLVDDDDSCSGIAGRDETDWWTFSERARKDALEDGRCPDGGVSDGLAGIAGDIMSQHMDASDEAIDEGLEEVDEDAREDVEDEEVDEDIQSLDDGD